MIAPAPSPAEPIRIGDERMYLRAEWRTLLLEQLAERLSLEQAGVELLDVFIAKCRDDSSSTLPLATLELMRDDELRHASICREAMVALGGDPNAPTVAAASGARSVSGALQVLADPASNLQQSLNALLMAEMNDLMGWELLVALAEQVQQHELASRFHVALEGEVEHEATLRAWLRTMVLAQAR